MVLPSLISFAILGQDSRGAGLPEHRIAGQGQFGRDVGPVTNRFYRWFTQVGTTGRW
jgi:hypothetical protein